MTSRVWLGVSLKMYFSHQHTRTWCGAVRDLVGRDSGVEAGSTEVVVLPTFLSVPTALTAFVGTPVEVGAQDLAAADNGAWTGEVSGAELHEVGCRYVEVGHAERRRHFGETPDVVAAKTSAALRNGLTPVLCVGEPEPGAAEAAAAHVRAEVLSAVGPARKVGLGGAVVVAYEPQWAIGASRPAPSEHVAAVGARLRESLATLGPARVVYGGSAGPGLLTELGSAVDGLFLGRFAHDPDAFAGILAEAARRPAHASS